MTTNNQILGHGDRLKAIAKRQRSARMEKALEALYLALELGFEFPDACSRVACIETVDYDKLRDAYDEAENKK